MSELIRVGGGEPCKHGVVITQAVCDLCCLEDEIARLKRGEFTAEEIHEICHNFPMTVGVRAFADGCAAEQRRLYGCAPDVDQVATLTAALAQAQRERDEVKRQWGDQTLESEALREALKQLRAAEQQLATLRAALQPIVEEMTTLIMEWRGHAKTNRIDAKDEANPELGKVAAAIHDACVKELKPLRDRLAALGGPQEQP